MWWAASATAAPMVSMVTPTAGHVTATRREQRKKCATLSPGSVCARWVGHRAHTRTHIPHPALTTVRCPLQENVQGSRCDQCRVGTFHLDPTNPKGCTSCFCFGATDRCRSSDKRRTEVMWWWPVFNFRRWVCSVPAFSSSSSLQIMNMEGWVLLGADRQELAVTLYPGQDLVEADLSDVPDVYQDLHWHAPKTYLGDKVCPPSIRAYSLFVWRPLVERVSGVLVSQMCFAPMSPPTGER